MRDSMASLSNNPEKMVAVGIDDFQVTSSSNGVVVAVRAIAEEQDFDHTDPDEGDYFWRMTMNVTAKPRNL